MNNADVKLMIDRQVGPIMDELKATLAIIQAYEALFLQLGVSHQQISHAVSATMSVQQLTDNQRSVVSILLSSV
jgi:hypothetical protein